MTREEAGPLMFRTPSTRRYPGPPLFTLESRSVSKADVNVQRSRRWPKVDEEWCMG